MISEDVLIYDVETETFGKPDPQKDNFRFFGCYSYKTKKFYLLKEKETVQAMINNHKFLVGFNNKDYDNVILERWGITFKYKFIIDMYIIFDSRSTVIKLEEGLLEDLLMEKSLDYISKLLKIVDDKSAKIHFNYKLLRKSAWTEDELKLIKDYTERDIEITKKMLEWLDKYFEGLKDFINEKDYYNMLHISADPAVIAYKAICHAMNWKDETNFNAIEEEKIKGGYVSYPSGERYVADTYCFDFDSLYPSIMNQCNLYGRKLLQEHNDRPVWNGGGIWKTEGTYYADTMSPVSALIRKWFELRMEYKKNKDPRENSIKIILNIIYGIQKNPKFMKTFDVVAAGDCTRLGRQFEQYARKIFAEKGYEIIYSDTDSSFIQDPFKDKEKMLKVRDEIINYIRSTLPFPYQNFGMKLDAEIKYLFFFKGKEEKEEHTEDFMSDSFDFINKPKGLMKKNYIYVTKENKLVIKNLGIKKKSVSKISRTIFWDNLVPLIKEKGEIRFSKKFIKDLISKYLDQDIAYACLRYDVGSFAQYKDTSPNSIYAQIAQKYGSGIIFLIPNNKIGIGKDKKYCTVEEFKQHNMKKEDINLDNVWSELNYFIRSEQTKNIFEF